VRRWRCAPPRALRCCACGTLCRFIVVWSPYECAAPPGARASLPACLVSFAGSLADNFSASEEEFAAIEVFKDRFHEKLVDRFNDGAPGMVNALLDVCFEVRVCVGRCVRVCASACACVCL
jgi:hypothetical protein